MSVPSATLAAAAASAVDIKTPKDNSGTQDAGNTANAVPATLHKTPFNLLEGLDPKFLANLPQTLTWMLPLNFVKVHNISDYEKAFRALLTTPYGEKYEAEYKIMQTMLNNIKLYDEKNYLDALVLAVGNIRDLFGPSYSGFYKRNKLEGFIVTIIGQQKNLTQEKFRNFFEAMHSLAFVWQSSKQRILTERKVNGQEFPSSHPLRLNENQQYTTSGQHSDATMVDSVNAVERLLKTDLFLGQTKLLFADLQKIIGEVLSSPEIIPHVISKMVEKEKTISKFDYCPLNSSLNPLYRLRLNEIENFRAYLKELVPGLPLPEQESINVDDILTPSELRKTVAQRADQLGREIKTIIDHPAYSKQLPSQLQLLMEKIALQKLKDIAGETWVLQIQDILKTITMINRLQGSIAEAKQDLATPKQNAGTNAETSAKTNAVNNAVVAASAVGAAAAAGAGASTLVITKAVATAADANLRKQANASHSGAAVRTDKFSQEQLSEEQLKAQLNQVTQLFNVWKQEVGRLFISCPSLVPDSMRSMTNGIRQSTSELSQVTSLFLAIQQATEENAAVARAETGTKAIVGASAEAAAARTQAKTTGSATGPTVVAPKPRRPIDAAGNVVGSQFSMVVRAEGAPPVKGKIHREKLAAEAPPAAAVMFSGAIGGTATTDASKPSIPAAPRPLNFGAASANADAPPVPTVASGDNKTGSKPKS